MYFWKSDVAGLFAPLKTLRTRRKITDADIRALVAGTEISNRDGFQFKDLRLDSQSDGSIQAQVTFINRDEEEVVICGSGKGSVEAVFNAIDQFFQQGNQQNLHHIDAILMGLMPRARVLVAMKQNWQTVFNASGIDFDVLEASAIAYIHTNVMVQKENSGQIDKKLSERVAN